MDIDKLKRGTQRWFPARLKSVVHKYGQKKRDHMNKKERS